MTGASAWQSSTTAWASADLALDGNMEGHFFGHSCTHTANGDANPYWVMELGSEGPVGRIVFYFRTDCYERKSQLNFLVSRTRNDVDEDIGTMCATYDGPPSDPRVPATITCDTFVYGRTIKNIDCLGIFNNNDIAIYKALTINVTTMPKLKPAHYIKMTKNCTSFINDRGYITHHLTEEERNFPIAFSILMYKDVEQAERLLRAIYRPQNIYCIHVDSKTDEKIYKAMSRIANCFQNVFLSNKRVNVTWGEISVLEPELLCMEQLWARNKKWKYFINLTGQEFPLKTNYELVQILKAYNGSNDVETTVVQKESNINKKWHRCLPKNEITPPHEINVTKGAVHIAVTRGFVDYSLHDPRARDILDYVNTSCKIPDEAYFTILNHNRHLGVPGSYKDLPLLSTRKELLANKFHLDEQPVTYGCLEELIFNRTRDEYQGKRTFDTSWYSNLGFVLAESKVD
ncbi:N-acetyllactosaminide beta-1,6-N-acetylglucosaminyl-transferase-like [Mercenaria mercenaria]|uniref:N-acetyllactosaminide beta-1,6-N-acetylglucosaminyl-transferase-like n=1 Tax=Mercenaria mercenaria TaxID=6596 RepID=UPI00234EA026|nr:N-acetyllactosaminide beta-1,6-N-acetylglucosaminyl-transferase-like [Mercenaria mercenaria]